MNKVVIYPGRFQPMLSHHVKVYDYLKKQFPDYQVYIGTSNKVAEDSPFTFKEKQAIATAQGIDPNNVLEAGQPYVHTFYKNFDHSDTVVIFAVGEKDMSTRFAMTNIDPETGLDMKIRPNKETGDIDPKYYQMINSMADNPLTMDKRGYLFEVPNIEDDQGEVESASAFRNALKDSPDRESAKSIFDRQFKEYNEDVFNLVYNKIAGNKMSEDLNIIKKLAGLNVDESAPVEFESNVEVKDLEFTPPSKSTAFHSIANRFPKGVDANDPEVKREQFIQALLKSPANLLAEINERISPADDNGLAASEKLNKIIHILGKREGGNLTDLDDDNKRFAMELVKKAIKEMELVAGDDSEYEDEPKQSEDLDLSEIRMDYGVVEGLDENMILSDLLEDVNDADFTAFIEDLSSDELGLLEAGWGEKIGAMAAGKPKAPKTGVVNIINNEPKQKDQKASMMGKAASGIATGVGAAAKAIGNAAGATAKFAQSDGKNFLKKVGSLLAKGGGKAAQLTKDARDRISPAGRDKANKARIAQLQQKRKEVASMNLSAKDLENLEIRIKQNTDPAFAMAVFDQMSANDEDKAGKFMHNFEIYGKVDAALMKIGVPDMKIDDIFDSIQFDQPSIEEGRMSDIHQDANSMDKEEFAKEHPEFADDWEGMQNDDNAEDEPRDDGSPAYKKYIGKHKTDEGTDQHEECPQCGKQRMILHACASCGCSESVTMEDEGSIRDMDDDELMDYVGQKEENIIDDIQQHIAPDFLHKDNYDEMFMLYREEVLEPAAEELSADKNADDDYHGIGTDYDSEDFVDNRNMVGDDEINQEESIEDDSHKALEAAMAELKQLAGLNS
jgi:hypothetical protein